MTRGGLVDTMAPDCLLLLCFTQSGTITSCMRICVIDVTVSIVFIGHLLQIENFHCYT